MLLKDFITEARLPLGKGAVRHARSNYGAFLCVMRPLDFIKLTTENEIELKSIFDRSKERLDYTSYQQTPTNQIPFLDMVWDTGKVTGHEGRHRAAMIIENGGTSFPCVIYPKIQLWKVEYRKLYRGVEEEAFESRVEAEARYAELKAEVAAQDPDDRDIVDMAVRKWYPTKARGHPERSEGWDYAKWTVEDFPDQLIGQYNNYTVPKSSMKIGIIKGHDHFRR